MKSLFALGAWSLTAFLLTGVAFGQVQPPSRTSTPYWVTTDAPVGSGVAPTFGRPPQQPYAPPAQAYQAPPAQAYQAPPRVGYPTSTKPNFGPVNYQRSRNAPLSNIPPADLPAPRPPARAFPAPGVQAPGVQGHGVQGHGVQGHGVQGHGVQGHGGPIPAVQESNGSYYADPAQLGVSPAQSGSFTLDSGAYCAEPGYGLKGHHVGGWFGGAGGLYINRDKGTSIWLSVDDGNIENKVLTTRDAAMDFAGGFEMSLGRYFKNNCYAWQLTYWGIFPTDENAYAYNGVDTVGQLGSSRTFDGLDYNGGTVASFYNVSDAHWLRRDYQFHNVEWNIFGSPCIVGCGGKGKAMFGAGGSKCGACGPAGVGCGSCGGVGCGACGHSALRWNWLAGVRYFRFDEGLTYATDSGDQVFNGSPDEAYYDIDIENHLFGFQIGGVADYCIGPRWNWRNAAKVGVYGSHTTHYQRIGGSAGTATVNNINSAYDGQDFLINSSKDDVAVLAEWDTAIAYQWTCHWRTRLGYRLVGINGVAFAADQMPTATYVDLGDVALIDTNGSMILHGGYASLEYSY